MTVWTSHWHVDRQLEPRMDPVRRFSGWWRRKGSSTLRCCCTTQLRHRDTAMLGIFITQAADYLECLASLPESQPPCKDIDRPPFCCLSGPLASLAQALKSQGCIWDACMSRACLIAGGMVWICCRFFTLLGVCVLGPGQSGVCSCLLPSGLLGWTPSWFWLFSPEKS